MPIYEYQCEECQERFDKLIRSSDASQEIVCPKCGSHKVRRLLSLFGLGKSGQKAGSVAPASSCGPT